jgi:hypothetical protein
VSYCSDDLDAGCVICIAPIAGREAKNALGTEGVGDIDVMSRKLVPAPRALQAIDEDPS